MSQKKVRRQVRFRRVENSNMTRDQAMLKNKQVRMAILKRRRRWLIAIMAAVVILVAFFVAFFIGAFDKKSDVTTLTVGRNGSIVFEERVNLDENTDEEKLRSFVKETIDEYNASADAGDVRLKKCEVSGNQVYLKTFYRNAKVYHDFTGLTFFVGTIEEAAKAGYELQVPMVSVDGGKKGNRTQWQELQKNKSGKIVIVDQPIDIVVPQSVVAVSDEGTVMKSLNKVGINEAVDTYIIY